MVAQESTSSIQTQRWHYNLQGQMQVMMNTVSHDHPS